MSEKLTREQIEWCRKVLTALTEGAVMKPGDTFGLKQPEWSKRVYALCDMALAWLDVQPRPIEEAPKNGTRLLLSGPDKDGGKYTDCSAWPEGWTGKWPVEYMAYSAGPPTHFIPLSSLPEPK